MSRVGEKVKLMREAAGMNQKQLGKKIGVSEGFINEVEVGRRVINENLIEKISKILGKDINDITMTPEEDNVKEEFKTANRIKTNNNVKPKDEVQDIWSNAFGSVLKNVPCFKYDLKTATSVRQMPLISNKIEGHAQDKVLFLQIENDDMIGFRIAQNDIAFGYITHEIENNAICLIEYNSERVIRQIKKLDSSKVLLISNKGSIRTETAYIKDINVLVKLDRVEIKL